MLCPWAPQAAYATATNKAQLPLGSNISCTGTMQVPLQAYLSLFGNVHDGVASFAPGFLAGKLNVELVLLLAFRAGKFNHDVSPSEASV